MLLWKGQIFSPPPPPPNMTLRVIGHVRFKMIVQEYYIQIALCWIIWYWSLKCTYGVVEEIRLFQVKLPFLPRVTMKQKSPYALKQINGQWTWRGRKSFGISADRNDWPGWLKDFFGFEIFQFQDFFGLVNLASIFWGGLIFLGIENNLKIRGIFPPIRSSLSLDRFPPPYPRATENLWNRDWFNFFKKQR